MARDNSLEIPGDLETNTAAQAGADHDPTATLAAITGATNDTTARSTDKPMSSTLPATHVAPVHPSQLERVVHVDDDRNPPGGDVEPWPVPLAEPLNQSGAEALGDPATGGE